ncbi:Lipoprotein-releasing system ATP-binding protein LolD [Planctomycetales bacterium 10988]|nr:Lipoprotein-releasing system ATP-binding protein LolD [Planctomycetales bacterium 10988]
MPSRVESSSEEFQDRNLEGIIPLQTEHLTKTFRQGTDSIKALNGVSLEVQAGQFLAIMGPSGCGKSTLLHVMAGLTRPDTGTVSVAGQQLASLRDGKLTDFRRRQIGLVFQQFNLVATLTALDNVMLPRLAEGKGGKPAKEKAISLLERLGLANRLDHTPDAMSGGEQQRVAIARALITDPAIILADEPTGSLDSANGHAICSLLKELNEEEKRTIVIVTHEPSVAAWAERVVVMKDGTVCCDWSDEEIHDVHKLASRYQDVVADPYVAQA